MNYVVRPVDLFILLVSLASALVTLFTGMNIVTALIFVIAIIVIVIVIGSISKRYYKFQIVHANDEIGVFRTPLECDFDQIEQLDKSVFKKNDLISKKIFLKWFRANRNTFNVLCVEDKVIGYYSILPLGQNTLEKFLEGTISEIDFTVKDILSSTEARNLSKIYFFSTVVDKEYRHRGFQIMQRLVDELKMKTTYPKVQKIYATAATGDGRRILQKLGFVQIADAADRKDRHDLFEYSYNA